MVEQKYDSEELKKLQALPLDHKIVLSKQRIKEWYEWFDGKVYVSFSGGKDSTVLLHLVRSMYPDVKAVFSNTGLEYPEIQKFVKQKHNVEIVTPEMRFDQVISTYGYPIISKEVAEAIRYSRRIRNAENKKQKTMEQKRKELNGTRELTENWRRKALLGKAGHDQDKSIFNKKKWLVLSQELPVSVSEQCCLEMKKKPTHKFEAQTGLRPIIGTLASESRVRKQSWLRHGCNSFDGVKISSQPLSFWTEQDILAYIVINDIEIASVYGDIVVQAEDFCQYSANELNAKCGQLMCTGCDRTGCVFCAFGMHLEKGETRFQRLAKTHPKQYEYALNGGQWIDNPSYDSSAPEYDGEWKNWNPKKIWIPSKEGLGFRKVFDMCNDIYGKDFYRYE